MPPCAFPALRHPARTPRPIPPEWTNATNDALAVAFGLSFWRATAVAAVGGPAFYAVSAAGRWHAAGETGRALALPITLALTFTVAMWGHSTVQLAERRPAYVLAAGFAAFLLFTLPQADFTALSAAGAGASVSAWSWALVVAFAGPFSYLPMPSDCTGGRSAASSRPWRSASVAVRKPSAGPESCATAASAVSRAGRARSGSPSTRSVRPCWSGRTATTTCGT